MTHVAKIIEIIESSDKCWTGAAWAALDEAKKTFKEITGLEINDNTPCVDPSTGTIKEYKVGVKIAFGIGGIGRGYYHKTCAEKLHILWRRNGRE